MNLENECGPWNDGKRTKERDEKQTVLGSGRGESGKREGGWERGRERGEMGREGEH